MPNDASTLCIQHCSTCYAKNSHSHNDDKCAMNQCSRTGSIHRIPYLFHFLCETASELAMLLTNMRGHTHVSLRELGNVNFQTTDLHPSFLSLCLHRVPRHTAE